MWVTPVIFRIVNYPPISTRSDTGRYYLLRLEDEGRIREGQRDAEQRVRQSRVDDIAERENQEEREQRGKRERERRREKEMDSGTPTV